GVEEFQNCRFVLIFFSAGWCFPCQNFLQILKDFYCEVNLEQKIIEIVYVSADKSEPEFKESYAKMPWITYPFSSPMHNELKQKFNIIGVPVVLVCDAQTGFMITEKGRKDIFDLGVNCLKSWKDD
ncbi:MAG: thioredoxin-like domain-containing protein, partial [bacterium]